MRIEDMPRPWLLAAVTGVPMATLLERADQEHAEWLEATWLEAIQRDEEERSSGPEPAQGCRNNVVMLPSWQ
jgi:hypothetical protein